MTVRRKSLIRTLKGRTIVSITCDYRPCRSDHVWMLTLDNGKTVSLEARGLADDQGFFFKEDV